MMTGINTSLSHELCLLYEHDTLKTWLLGILILQLLTSNLKKVQLVASCWLHYLAQLV